MVHVCNIFTQHLLLLYCTVCVLQNATFLPTVSSKLAYLHLAKYLLCISVVLIYYVIFTDGALTDEQTPAVMGISSADCIPSVRRTLADDTTHVDTAVSTTGEVQILFVNSRVVEDSLVSFSILFQYFRVFGKND